VGAPIDPLSDCQDSRFGAIFDLKLPKERLEITFNGFSGNMSDAANFFVIKALCKQLQHRQL
jgi:hypothetical protein